MSTAANHDYERETDREIHRHNCSPQRHCAVTSACIFPSTAARKSRPTVCPAPKADAEELEQEDNNCATLSTENFEKSDF